MKHRWFIPAVLLLTVPILVAAPTALPARALSPALDVKPDYDKKTITITARMAFYLPTFAGVNLSDASAVQEGLKAIRADIERFWGGHKFLCFKVEVVPILRIAAGPNDVRDDEVAIRLDPAPVPIKGGTAKVRANVAAGGTQRYLSEDPADSATPATGPPRASDPVISIWPMGGTNGVYAHEFGHVLGLDDNYDSSVTSAGAYPTLPGAADDLMRLQGQAVDPTTITRMIRRTKKVDESKMKSAITADLASSDFGIHGAVGGAVALHMWTCRTSPPSNAGPPQTPMVFDGGIELTGEVNAGPFGSGSGGGSVPLSTSLTPGDPFFRVLSSANGGALDLSQAIIWTTGSPEASYPFASLSMAIPLANPIVFSDDAKECK